MLPERLLQEPRIAADSVAQFLPHTHQPVTVIEPSGGWRALDLRELWRYRELVYFLAWRDVKVRYKQTLLGATWALIQPLAATGIFTIFFGVLAKMPSDGVPYPLFAYIGLLPWTYFSTTVGKIGGSLVANTNLISKVYFPRLVIPLAGVVSGLIDLGIGFCLLMAFLVFFGVAPSAAMLTVPLFVAFAVVTALSIGIWLSALDVQYRDIRYVIPFLVQTWLFATPIVYPASLLPEKFRPLYGLNPMVGVVEGFRWAVLGSGEFPGLLLAPSVALVLVLLVTGLAYFRHVERTFADVI